ncbi:RNA polymerase sigma factor [Parapedobacter koreensis]|uniref:RNA polymerase, sigma subunit, ECF family n=1 Tax=Parapedobacter koreensis TaxID=332977 RepID=A0A1H7QMH8_9SPHI|nr:RNA polymerase sigma factor [Parapedobacter koreensis]SEL49321.1 RNA polymerase, sigma subunit, ECF family [Parapedobacter koreensis]
MQPVEKKDEIELIALCRAGHDVGFTGLYNKYAKPVYNSICRIISHTAEAEDILQESFYHAFADIHRLQNTASFGAWVNRIALNRSITHIRKRKIFFTDADEIEIADEEGYDEDATELFDCKVEDVRKAIEQLPQGYKTILSLYLFEDIPQEEIGKMLGVSHTTVRTQYHRAKKKVIQALKNKTLS